MPFEKKTAKLVRVYSAATTYHLSISGGGHALCTVNDETGELSISCDWGAWTYRWHTAPSSLGAPTLTHFLTDCHAEYVVRKLTGGSANEFDSEATAKALNKLLCERRLRDGRKWNRRYHHCVHSGSTGRPNECCEDRLPMPASWEEPERYGGGRYLRAERARDLFDQIEDHGQQDHPTSESFIRWLDADDLAEFVTEEWWNHTVDRPKTSTVILHDTILPTLFEACKDAVRARESNAPLASEPSYHPPATDTSTTRSD